MRTERYLPSTSLTGTELTLEEADSWENGEDLTLADYAGQYIESYLGSWFGINNSGYQASVNLMTNLSNGKLGSLDDILSYKGTASGDGGCGCFFRKGRRRRILIR